MITTEEKSALVSKHENSEESQFALTPVGQSIKQFEAQQRIANMYSQSDLVPKMYAGKIGNCVIALDMAMRMGANPLMLMQNLYIVHNVPSFSSKFLVASINASGKFSSLRYEFRGDEGTPEWACRAYAYELKDPEREKLYGAWITMAMAKSEGWSTKAGSKWVTMPEQMLRYRAAAFWQRAFAPEISMGFLSTEEVQDMHVEDVEYEDLSERAQTASTFVDAE